MLNCIDNVMYGEVIDNQETELYGGSDWVECTKFAVLSTSALIILALFIILLIIQVKKYGCHRDLALFKRVKTWVLIFAISLLFLFFLTQFITPIVINWALYSIIWALVSIFRQLTALTFFTFVAKRTKKLMTAD